MADWINYLASAPPARNLNALSTYYRPPSLQDVVAVAAYGDARQNARIRKKLQEIRMRDEIARQRASLGRGGSFLPGPPVVRSPQPAHFQPPWLAAPPAHRPSSPDKIERSPGRRRKGSEGRDLR